MRLNGRADGVRAAGWHMGGGRGRRGVGLACTGAPPGREQCDVQGWRSECVPGEPVGHCVWKYCVVRRDTGEGAAERRAKAWNVGWRVRRRQTRVVVVYGQVATGMVFGMRPRRMIASGHVAGRCGVRKWMAAGGSGISV